MFIRKLFINAYMILCRILFGVDKNKVLFESFNGKSYSDNPKAVSEYLHKIADEIKIVWITQDVNNTKGAFPEYIRLVDVKNKWKFYMELATSAVFVTNFQLPNINKSKKQFFIQTWHGDRAFKKILRDSEFYKGSSKIVEEIEGFCNLAVAGSDYGEKQYKSAFLYKGKIVKVGTPRNDALVKSSIYQINALKDSMGIDKNVKILLFAPTLRRMAHDAHIKQVIQEIEIENTLEVLEKKFNCKWVCFVRAHSAVCGITGVDFNERIIDVSSYEDMADLLLISDMLITDYSSCAGDFALLDRPVILFQSDYEDYLKYDRGLYFDMKDSPYFVAKNQADLECIIEDLTDDGVVKNCSDILEFYGTNETGRSSEVVVEYIINWIKK